MAVVKQGKQQFQGVFKELWTVTETTNFAEVADGGETVDDIAVPGVALGDMVIAASIGINQEDLALNAWVKAAGEVRVQVSNNTGGSINLASTTVKLIVGRPNF